MTSEYHIPVLVNEVIHYLLTGSDGIYIDGTLGGGGHAESIMSRLSEKGRLIGFDIDEDALQFSNKRLKKFGDRVIYIHDNFSNVRNVLNDQGLSEIDGFLLDLGVSSHQLDVKHRGFSFQSESRIDMRMDQNQSFDGWKIINTYERTKLAEIFKKYGEERHSWRIAKKIVDMRNKKGINTTGELATVVESITGARFLKKSLARIFQAIRIEVNNELENLHQALKNILDVLIPGGRIVVISYHSLEDRIVKKFLIENSLKFHLAPHKYLLDTPIKPKLNILTKKPINASFDEIQNNPRAKSAKLRAAKRI
ncbi:MAG: 16S rRNA (cytosine(1402)-N(4))-methyltransferase RsmH [Bacteroidota bacterium]|nr:16S rRNA (cytosine(1402)-N(4))-methyltransferase RsmH [Bacteroidota bacterium]